MCALKSILLFTVMSLTLMIHQTTLGSYYNNYHDMPKKLSITLVELYEGNPKGIDYLTALLKRTDPEIMMPVSILETLQAGKEKPRYDGGKLKQTVKQLIANGVDRQDLMQIYERILALYSHGITRNDAMDREMYFAMAIWQAAKETVPVAPPVTPKIKVQTPDEFKKEVEKMPNDQLFISMTEHVDKLAQTAKCAPKTGIEADIAHLSNPEYLKPRIDIIMAEIAKRWHDLISRNEELIQQKH